MSNDYINMHKRIAMGQPHAETHLKKGGKVQKYADGGSVGPISNSSAANLPAKGAPKKADFNAGKAKVATMKKGGSAKPGLGVMIAIGRPVKSAGRGR